MKIKTTTKYSSLLFYLLLIFMVFTLLDIKVSAITDHNSESIKLENLICNSQLNESSINLETNVEHFPIDDIIIVSYYVNSEFNISNIDYIQSGFQIKSITTDPMDAKRIIVELNCLPNYSKHSLSLKVQLETNQCIETSLYTISSDIGIFISPFSVDDATQNYLIYAKSNNYISESDYHSIKAEMSRVGAITEDYIIKSSHTNELNVLQNKSSSTDTQVRGTLQWIDDAGNVHPLIGVMVEIYEKELIGSILMATAYSDDYGNYSYTFNNEDDFFDFENGGCDIFIRAYAGDNNAMVRNSDNDTYYYESSISKNVETGDTVIKSMTMDMTSDLGQAFQISQAILTVRNYVWEITNIKPTKITIWYPYGITAGYYPPSNLIGIPSILTQNNTVPNSYASWDVIMHEYGHHIAYHLGTSDNPGGKHFFDLNTADLRNNKDAGVKLAWNEAWATVLGMLAQDYYSNILQDIDKISLTTYDSYNFSSPFDIENNTIRYGDACESTIISILWDLYDNSNDTNDNISLGHKNYWDITTVGQSKTFSEFINKFYAFYPSYIDDIAPNLTYYKMAPTKPTLSTIGTATSPPTFTWTPQGGSVYYPNNSFVLIFYDYSGEEIIRTQSTTNSSYTLTMDEWYAVRSAYGRAFSVAVEATQTASPVTGPYISDRLTNCRKPAAASIEESITFSSSQKYIEKKVNLIPKQTAKFRITFQESGTQLIQTFGTKATFIAILDSTETNLLYSNNGSGYGDNSLISYYFNADTEYVITVKFYSQDECGDIKFLITPAQAVHNNDVSAITKYEDIYSFEPHPLLNYTLTFSPYTTKVMAVQVPSNRNYTFTLDSNISTHLYIIDPRSSDLSILNVNCNTSGTFSYDATVTIDLDANVPYLILISPNNPSAISDGSQIILNITRNT